MGRIRSSKRSSASAARWLILLLLLVSATSYGRDRAAIDFDLNNWDGEAFSMEKLKGRVVVLTFSYAFCSVSCPIITGRLKTLDEAMDSPGKAVYLHVSIDPEMDTPERRKDYFNLYNIDVMADNRWMFLSGSKDELEKLWNFYGVTIEKMKNPMLPEGYFMKYSPKVMVIGKDGNIKRKADFYFLEEELAVFLEGLL